MEVEKKILPPSMKRKGRNKLCSPRLCEKKSSIDRFSFRVNRKLHSCKRDGNRGRLPTEENKHIQEEQMTLHWDTC